MLRCSTPHRRLSSVLFIIHLSPLLYPRNTSASSLPPAPPPRAARPWAVPASLHRYSNFYSPSFFLLPAASLFFQCLEILRTICWVEAERLFGCFLVACRRFWVCSWNSGWVWRIGVVKMRENNYTGSRFGFLSFIFVTSVLNFSLNGAIPMLNLSAGAVTNDDITCHCSSLGLLSFYISVHFKGDYKVKLSLSKTSFLSPTFFILHFLSYFVQILYELSLISLFNC